MTSKFDLPRRRLLQAVAIAGAAGLASRAVAATAARIGATSAKAWMS